MGPTADKVFIEMLVSSPSFCSIHSVCVRDQSAGQADADEVSSPKCPKQQNVPLIFIRIHKYFICLCTSCVEKSLKMSRSVFPALLWTDLSLVLLTCQWRVPSLHGVLPLSAVTDQCDHRSAGTIPRQCQPHSANGLQLIQSQWLVQRDDPLREVGGAVMSAIAV